MDNTLSKIEAPVTVCTGEYLDKLLNSPHNSSAMDTELQKINAHFVHDENLIVRVIAFMGIACVLLAVACLVFLPGAAFR